MRNKAAAVRVGGAKRERTVRRSGGRLLPDAGRPGMAACPRAAEADARELEESAQAWLRTAGRAALLTPEQEVRLARRIEEARARCDAEGERAAKHLMVLANLRLVASVARRYAGHGLPLEDLMQEGTMGLMRAVDGYSYRRGYRFSTYAIWWIRRSVSRAIADQSRVIRLPVHVTDTLARLNKTRAEMQIRLGRNPTQAELATEMQMPEQKLARAMRGAVATLSLDAPASEDGAGRLADRLPAAESESPLEESARQRMRAAIGEALNDLTPREREVVVLRYGLDGGEARTLEQVGRELAITRERVRQIETSALARLRQRDHTARLRDLIE